MSWAPLNSSKVGRVEEALVGVGSILVSVSYSLYEWTYTKFYFLVLHNNFDHVIFNNILTKFSYIDNRVKCFVFKDVNISYNFKFFLKLYKVLKVCLLLLFHIYPLRRGFQSLELSMRVGNFHVSFFHLKKCPQTTFIGT